MGTYKVAIAGLGTRGKTHLKGFLDNNDRFEVIALCDINEKMLSEVSETSGIRRIYTDADSMLAHEKPDVFCFATLPDVRSSMVELAVKHKVKALAFEKPMATSLKEAHYITSLCKENGIKAIVSHQQKYLTSFQKLKSIVDSGEIGAITKIHATTIPWLSQLGTHFMDYMIWINGGGKAKWVLGHVHGKDKLSDHHPSPDYMLGKVQFENGIHAYIECGYLSPSFMKDKFWADNRLTVHGTHGYAWADSDGRWGGFTSATKGDMVIGEGPDWDAQQHLIQTPYLKDLADWLDDDSKVHSCNIETSYHGYEILEGLGLSALEHRLVTLPLLSPESIDVIERMKSELPE
ncbi:Gfo/Idh/MocA family protein [Paenibacillus montanisoli]|uniref:Gfo/Idh/MocA family oxidoreductase n=1 Tax=Paenibacillus montanisoli TaxID=2081970 RepID=A0A328U9B8_9BACL|nr:Gfo/Idh/MocA family oxidoreductase [Paenibacillus montanisoli]RAP78413.1 gfo/Idh/MocA family oxidoreductase [Paenibacillus montanisoli]